MIEENRASNTRLAQTLDRIDRALGAQPGAPSGADPASTLLASSGSAVGPGGSAVGPGGSAVGPAGSAVGRGSGDGWS